MKLIQVEICFLNGKDMRSFSYYFLGKIYSFNIVANEVGTTDDFREMSLEERGCRLPHETTSHSMFKSYTKSSCEFECAIQRAVKTCLCKPWSVGRYQGENTSYCDVLGNRCFIKIINNTETFDNCNCDDDCHSINFNVFQSNNPLDDKDIWFVTRL